MQDLIFSAKTGLSLELGLTLTNNEIKHTINVGHKGERS